jgi:hypothetical protein
MTGMNSMSGTASTITANDGPRVRVRTPRELRRERRSRRHGCWDHLIAAPLRPMHGVNLGTLLRTCDAVGACMAVPRLPWVPEALAKGNTLRRPACVHWTGRDVRGWLEGQHRGGSRVIGVELAEDAVRLFCTASPASCNSANSAAAIRAGPGDGGPRSCPGGPPS